MDEIAAVVRLLVGPEGGRVTGQTVHVNGVAFLTWGTGPRRAPGR
jgi:3-oxoacyl-[acyl-carrier protein] reductase